MQTLTERYLEAFPGGRKACGFLVEFAGEEYGSGLAVDLADRFSEITFVRFEFTDTHKNEKATCTFTGTTVLIYVYDDDIEVVGEYSGGWYLRVEGKAK